MFRDDRMVVMRRRDFMRLSLLASSSALAARHGLAAAQDMARLTIDPRQAGNVIGPDFTGLSYETAQLGDPEFFTPANAELVGLVKRLGRSGVLRIGGNTSEYSRWTPETPSAMGPEMSAPQGPVGPDTGKHPPRPTIITPHAIRNLRGFIDATGWKLIYGLNMGTETPETAAAEATYVFNTFGPRLIAFQLCNEPDLFSRNGIRQAGYNYATFAKEWRRFYDAIKQAIPGAPFAGPDTAFNNEWLLPFANEFQRDIAFLSQHYYAEGPPTDPSMTINRLLRPNPKLKAEFDGMEQTRKDTGLPFRLAETNSCYSGGKQGVSNTFASALWGPELMYQLAQAGGDGINFHGGGFGWYTPIAGTREKGFSARPIYYGMLLFAQAGSGRLVASRLDYQQEVPLLTAYSLRSDEGNIKTAIFNKHQDRNIRVVIDTGERTASASALRLAAPGIESTAGVTLAGSAVERAGTWRAQQAESLPVNQNLVTIELRAASAALVSFTRR
jgi:hypothetical protein